MGHHRDNLCGVVGAHTATIDHPVARLAFGRAPWQRHALTPAVPQSNATLDWMTRTRADPRNHRRALPLGVIYDVKIVSRTSGRNKAQILSTGFPCRWMQFLKYHTDTAVNPFGGDFLIPARPLCADDAMVATW
jgi:hypothetical protein